MEKVSGPFPIIRLRRKRNQIFDGIDDLTVDRNIFLLPMEGCPFALDSRITVNVSHAVLSRSRLVHYR